MIHRHGNLRPACTVTAYTAVMVVNQLKNGILLYVNNGPFASEVFPQECIKNLKHPLMYVITKPDISHHSFDTH